MSESRGLCSEWILPLRLGGKRDARTTEPRTYFLSIIKMILPKQIRSIAVEYNSQLPAAALPQNGSVEYPNLYDCCACGWDDGADIAIDIKVFFVGGFYGLTYGFYIARVHQDYGAAAKTSAG